MIAAVVGGLLAALALVVVLLVVVIGGGDEPEPRPNSVGSTTPAAGGAGNAPAAKPKPVQRSRYRVSVLNGTTFTGLARNASTKLVDAGYKEGVVTTDEDNQARRVTEVFFEPRSRPAGLDVAKQLGVRTGSVKTMDERARALAGGAEVVVFIGADKAQ